MTYRIPATHIQVGTVIDRGMADRPGTFIPHVGSQAATCTRCKGTGMTNFANQGGICFKCNGTGKKGSVVGAGMNRVTVTVNRIEVTDIDIRVWGTTNENEDWYCSFLDDEAVPVLP